jgi:RND family efflux transporter MFP subunit
MNLLRAILHPMRKATTGALLIVLLPALLTACSREEEKSEPEIRPVRTVTVEKREAGETVSLAGTVESQVQVDLAFRIGGRLIERNVTVGDKIKAGQLIARLDPTDERNALRAAEASLIAANGQLSEARLNYDRQRHLYERQIAARVAFERAEQVFTTAQAAVKAAEAQVGLAQQRLDDTELYADAPGVITARGAETGEVVQPGRMIVQVARDEGKDAVFNVPANIRAASHPDPEVTVALSLSPDVTAKGRVREIAPRADAATGTFRVRVGLIDPPTEMRLGSTVVGRTTFARHAGIELPASALTSSSGQPAVWIVDPKSMTVVLRPIGVARFNPGSVVVSDGVTPGELVVTAGVQALRPGQKVRLLGAAS